ncbi:hypothetical protein [Aureimonas sp. AU20]|uniref:hypothetical protein n=1 Tax=Aureimonas sp. AU20 TaxID=1349819 RepID=UPI0007216833|nr:hypothetical protein [Aureimonas sp. AU20]ALN71854.1 LysR family transcriptional regulator [Aureimonas sp. AU20]
MSVEPADLHQRSALHAAHGVGRRGITFATEDTFRAYVERGELVSLLDAFLEPFAGFLLCFAHRRHMAPTLRAFVDFVRDGQDATWDGATVSGGRTKSNDRMSASE